MVSQGRSSTAPARYTDCPDKSQHAEVVYGNRWRPPNQMQGGYPRLDGRSVARTHKQTRCPTCGFYVVWTPRVTAADASFSEPSTVQGPNNSAENASPAERLAKEWHAVNGLLAEVLLSDDAQADKILPPTDDASPRTLAGDVAAGLHDEPHP